MEAIKYDGIVLMGPFGSGKTHLGKCLHLEGIGTYLEIEPILYDRFSEGNDLNLEQASEFIRKHYFDSLSSSEINMPIFESTGIVQRPLLLEVMQSYNLAIVKVVVSKEVSLERVQRRNLNSHTVISPKQVVDFYDNWMESVAKTYNFSVEVDGANTKSAMELIKGLLQ